MEKQILSIYFNYRKGDKKKIKKVDQIIIQLSSHETLQLQQIANAGSKAIYKNLAPYSKIQRPFRLKNDCISQKNIIKLQQTFLPANAEKIQQYKSLCVLEEITFQKTSQDQRNTSVDHRLMPNKQKFKAQLLEFRTDVKLKSTIQGKQNSFPIQSQDLIFTPNLHSKELNQNSMVSAKTSSNQLEDLDRKNKQSDILYKGQKQERSSSRESSVYSILKISKSTDKKNKQHVCFKIPRLRAQEIK